MKRLSRKEQVAVIKRLAHLLSYGVPLVKALKAAKVDEAVEEAVSCGATLASSMEPYFNPEAVSIIGACEAGGSTQQGLVIAAEYLEKTAEIRKKIISSLAYPAAVITASIACLVFFLFSVFPQMIGFSLQMGIDPPAQVVALYSFVKLLPYLLTFLAAAAVLAVYFSTSKKFSPAAEACKLRLPLLGKIIKKLNCSRIAGMLYYMLSSGLPLCEALGNTSKALSSRAFRKSVEGVLDNVRQGQSLAGAFESDNNFDEELVFAARLGQESGRTEDMLKGSCKALEDEAYELIKRAVSFVEPAATIASGAAVAFIALSVLSPITKILGSLQ